MIRIRLDRLRDAAARGPLRAAGLLPLLLAAACATAPTAPTVPGVAEPETTAASGAAIDAETTGPARPQIELSGDLLYRIMVAEIAGQRGELETSVRNYLELARETRDPKVVERAAQIAVYARDIAAAADAARLWVELDPHNPDAHQVLALAALRDSDLERALEHLQNFLDHSRGPVDQKLLLIANLLGREQDRSIVLTLMERLVASRADSPDALYAFAHVAARLGDLDRSRELLQRAVELAPQNDDVALSYVSVLQRQDRIGDALAWLEQTLPGRKDDDFNLRLAYARLLTDARRYDDARRQFEILAVQAPNNFDVLYALALLYLQANRLDDAESYFTRLAGQDERGNDSSYYLGRIAEDRKDYAKAAVWYQGVQRGENYFDAQVRLGLIMARQGRPDEAREHLRGVRASGAEQKTVLVQAEAELLIEEQRHAEAMQVYDAALAAGDNSDLRYARAMLAEKMDRLDLLEADLRRILEQEPDHPQALNALGYTLADRTDRYAEAYELIKRALELAPGDFYILDSMGWVLYRLGRMDEAVDYLRQALAARQDPEIAAHLGEVLWVTGDQDGAREVWNTAIKATPDDSSLLDVIRRFSP